MSTEIPSRGRRAGWAALMVVVLAVPTLEGCGKKASHLDPPEGSGPAAALYPRIYPNPKHDPMAPSSKAPKAPPASEPVPAGQVYPRMIRPDNLTPTSALALPGQSSDGASPWPDARKGQ